MNPLYIFTGYSGSGKCAIANILETVGNYAVLKSYTTRSKRNEENSSHIFTTESDFMDIQNKLAYTEVGDFKYCTTMNQLESSDIFVMNGQGIEDILSEYNNARRIIVFYFDANIRTRIDNMRKRGDGDKIILNKIYKDEESDLESDLHKIVWNYKHNENCDVDMITINANRDIDVVVKEVSFIMNEPSENK